MNTLKTFEQYTPSDEIAGSQSRDPFQHHRLIAGYHEHKAKSLDDAANDAEQSSSPGIQRLAQNYRKRQMQHMDKYRDNIEQARLLHDPKWHGTWDEINPTVDQCVTYFNNH